jgi:hypothetical protein
MLSYPRVNAPFPFTKIVDSAGSRVNGGAQGGINSQLVAGGWWNRADIPKS